MAILRFFRLNFLLAVFFTIVSCASLEHLPGWKTIKDQFAKTYPTDFSSFHPKLNMILHDFFQKKGGGSFRVIRLGKDSVVFQGAYKKEPEQNPLTTMITAKFIGDRKTRVEISLSSTKPVDSREYLEGIASEIFGVIEAGTGISPIL